jgi:poly(A) polymerase
MLPTAAAVLREHGVEGWLVGGTVRDRELGRYSPDIDLAVSGDAAALSRDIARALGAPWFTLSEPHQAYRVVGRQGHVDLAAVRGGGILADLGERDFTINAMAIPIGGGELVDPFGGLAHLRARQLVAVSDRIFIDDPVRLMRAARFSHVLGLDLEPGLSRAVRAQAEELSRSAPERVAMEVFLTLAAGRAADAARMWHDLGLLRAIVPEMAEGRPEGEAARKCRSRGERPQEEDPGLRAVFARLDRLEEVLATLPDLFPMAASVLERRLAEPVDGAVGRPVALRLAAIGAGLGPAEAGGLGRRLRVSGALISLLVTAATMRGRPQGLPRVGPGRPGRPDSPPAPLRPQPAPALRPAAGGGEQLCTGPGREAIEFLWAAAPWEPEVILLAAASATSDDPAGGTLCAADELLSLWAERTDKGVSPLPVDGVFLMHELGLPPGPLLGKALRAARLAWEAGEAATREEVLAVARRATEET